MKTFVALVVIAVACYGLGAFDGWTFALKQLGSR